MWDMLYFDNEFLSVCTVSLFFINIASIEHTVLALNVDSKPLLFERLGIVTVMIGHNH